METQYTKMYALVDELKFLNINSHVEYGPVLEVEENCGTVYHFGFANGTFGWNDSEGNRGGESIYEESATPKELAHYVDAVLNDAVSRKGEA